MANTGAVKSLSSIRSAQPSSEGGRGADWEGTASMRVRIRTDMPANGVCPEYVHRYFAAQQERLVPKFIHSLISCFGNQHDSLAFLTSLYDGGRI